MSYYIYFIRSKKCMQVYVGRTDKDPQIRLQEHNNGKTAWTKSRRPFELIYYEKYFCKTDAIMREKYYKSGFGKLIKKGIIQILKKNHGT